MRYRPLRQHTTNTYLAKSISPQQPMSRIKPELKRGKKKRVSKGLTKGEGEEEGSITKVGRGYNEGRKGV